MNELITKYSLIEILKTHLENLIWYVISASVHRRIGGDVRPLGSQVCGHF